MFGMVARVARVEPVGLRKHAVVWLEAEDWEHWVGRNRGT